MGADQGDFAHTLLFQCEKCKQPLALSVQRVEKNLEIIDAMSFDLICICGWSKASLGIDAVRHWVTDWNFDRAKGNLEDQPPYDQFVS